MRATPLRRAYRCPPGSPPADSRSTWRDITTRSVTAMADGAEVVALLDGLARKRPDLD